MSMMSETAIDIPPITREQAFLETYFQCLSQCAYEKARELTEKEKDPNLASLWGCMVAALAQLANTEKAYMSLMYLVPNWFGRKDSLRNTYHILLAEFRKVEDTVAKQSNPAPLDTLIGHLCGQLWQYVQARSKTMDFYDQVVTMGTMKFVNFEDLHVVMTDIIHTHQKSFHHPILSPLKTLFSTECDIVSHLLKAQIDMAQCKFLPSLLHLNDATSKLSSCHIPNLEKETKKFAFGSPSKSSQKPALYQWLWKFRGLLLSKYSLYFHEILSKQAPSIEMKNIGGKLPVDLFVKVASFQRKADATNVSIVLDTNGLSEPFKGLGYQHPQKFTEPLTGLESYPAIFSYPGERPLKHLPAIVSNIQDLAKTLATTDKTVCVLNEIEKIQCTYFMSRVESLLTLVVIFENKKSEKDSFVNNFIQEVTTVLRLSKLFAGIKPGKG